METSIKEVRSYFMIREETERELAYGGYETVEEAKEFLPKNIPAHIEKVTEIIEIVK